MHSALKEGVKLVVEDLLRKSALQALQLREALVVRDNLLRVQRQHAQARCEVGFVRFRLASCQAPHTTRNQHAERCGAVQHEGQRR